MARKDLIALLSGATEAELAEAQKVVSQRQKSIKDAAVGIMAAFAKDVHKLIAQHKLPLALKERVEKDVAKWEKVAVAATGPDVRPSKKAEWWAKIKAFRFKDGTIIDMPASAAKVVTTGLKFAPKTFVHPQHKPEVGKAKSNTDDRLWLMTHYEEFKAATGTTALLVSDLKKPRAPKPKVKTAEKEQQTKS